MTDPRPKRALSAAYERIDPAENPALAAAVDRERRCLFATAVFRLVRQEADASRCRHPRATTKTAGDNEAQQP